MSNLIQVTGPSGEVFTFDRNTNEIQLADGKVIQTRELSASDVHLQSVLANVAFGYGSSVPFAIADQLAPPILVSKMTDKYHTWSSADLLNDVSDDIVGDEGEIKTVSPSKSSDSYTTVGYGLASFVSRNVELNADASINPRMAAIRRVMNAMAIRREVRAAAVIDDAATGFLSYKTTLAAGAKWNGGATSDPVKDLFTAFETAYKPVNVVGMSERTWHSMLQNANVQKYGLSNIGDRVMGMAPGEVARRLGMEGVEFVIGRMKRKSPTAGTIGYIWGNDVYCLHVPAGATADEEEIPTVRTFRFNGGNPNGNGYEVREWELPGKGARGGRMVAVICDEVCKLVAAPTGHLIVGAWQ